MSNTEVPYRVRFFNELAKCCDLTVIYDRKKSAKRDAAWAKGEKGTYSVKYLRGITVSDDFAISFGLLKEIFSGYDRIIVGCYTSPAQMLAILMMRLFRIPYFLNLDGEIFCSEKGIKSKIKRFLLTGAAKYLVAGEKAAESLKRVVGDKEIIPYYFSSLTAQELDIHERLAKCCVRSDTVLVIGQYFDYKGMDIAIEAARKDKSISYKFIGTGARTQLFLDEKVGTIPSNVEIIPFLPKQELEKEYQNCAMLVLPSRKECWGLVINEAASFGMPIVSTWGSGAAVEFLAEEYPQFLAKPRNAEDLLMCINKMLLYKEKSEFTDFMLHKSKQYCIEQMVEVHKGVLL